jgi:hypothetical protein
MARRAELVRRALRYPYPAPSRSYVEVGGATLDLAEIEVDLGERTPLLAYGSNAAPEVLRRKLGSEMEPVPALRGILSGFDAVYSAHVSPYGAVPATLWPSPGTQLPVFVIYLTEEQLQKIAATEPNYERRTLEGASCRLEGASCRLEDGASAARSLTAYLSRHGPLLRAGSPIALAEVAARGRSLAAIEQWEAIDGVRRAIRPNVGLESFIAEAASSPELPSRLTAALRSNGREAAQGEPRQEAVADREQREVDQRAADLGP